MLISIGRIFGTETSPVQARAGDIRSEGRNRHFPYSGYGCTGTTFPNRERFNCEIENELGLACDACSRIPQCDFGSSVTLLVSRVARGFSLVLNRLSTGPRRNNFLFDNRGRMNTGSGRIRKIRRGTLRRFAHASSLC